MTIVVFALLGGCDRSSRFRAASFSGFRRGRFAGVLAGWVSGLSARIAAARAADRRAVARAEDGAERRPGRRSAARLRRRCRAPTSPLRPRPARARRPRWSAASSRATHDLYPRGARGIRSASAGGRAAAAGSPPPAASAQPRRARARVRRENLEPSLSRRCSRVPEALVHDRQRARESRRRAVVVRRRLPRQGRHRPRVARAAARAAPDVRRAVRHRAARARLAAAHEAAHLRAERARRRHRRAVSHDLRVVRAVSTCCRPRSRSRLLRRRDGRGRRARRAAGLRARSRCSALSAASWRPCSCRRAPAITSRCSATTRCSNVAIVGIAWFKAWRVLNVLGFAVHVRHRHALGLPTPTRPSSSRRPSRSSSCSR